MTFDYSKRIILKNWKEFLSKFEDEDIFQFECKATSSGEFSKSDLRLLFDPDIADLIEDSDILKLIHEDDTLIFNGSDFRWWCQDNRADKIFSIKSKETKTNKRQSSSEKSTDVDSSMNVKICEVKDGEYCNIKEFSGSKKACIQFINQHYYVYVLRARSSDSVRLSINDSEWKKFTELQEEGVIV